MLELVVVEKVNHRLTQIVVGKHQEGPLQRLGHTHKADGRDAEDEDHKECGQASDNIEDGHTHEGSTGHFEDKGEYVHGRDDSPAVHDEQKHNVTEVGT